MKTDRNLLWNGLTVHWSKFSSLFRSYLWLAQTQAWAVKGNPRLPSYQPMDDRRGKIFLQIFSWYVQICLITSIGNSIVEVLRSSYFHYGISLVVVFWKQNKTNKKYDIFQITDKKALCLICECLSVINASSYRSQHILYATLYTIDIIHKDIAQTIHHSTLLHQQWCRAHRFIIPEFRSITDLWGLFRDLVKWFANWIE